MWQSFKKLFGRGNKVDVQTLYEQSSSKNEQEEISQSRPVSKRLYEGNWSKRRVEPKHSSTQVSRPPSSVIREVSTYHRDEEINYSYIEPSPTSRKATGTRSPPRSLKSPRIMLPPLSPQHLNQDIPSSIDMIHTRPSEKDTLMLEGRKSIPIISTFRRNAMKSSTSTPTSSTPLPLRKRRFSPASHVILRSLRSAEAAANPSPPVTLIVRKSLFKEIMRR